MSHSTADGAPATTGRSSNATPAAGPIAWHGSVNGHAQAVVLVAGMPSAERPNRR